MFLIRLTSETHAAQGSRNPWDQGWHRALARRELAGRAPGRQTRCSWHQTRVPGPVGPSHLEEAEPGTVQAIFAWLVSFISPWLLK